MKRLMAISILAFSSFSTLCALGQTGQVSPYVETGTTIINNSGFKSPSIRTTQLTRPVPQHLHNSPLNATVASRFVVAKADVAGNGTWAWACGWNTSANSTSTGATAALVPTGCAAYFEVGADALAGRWRVPTQRELSLITICRLELAAQPGFTALNSSRTYWSSTQMSASQSWTMTISGSSMYNRDKTLSLWVRCVRDLP